MLAELENIFYIIGDICKENCMLILICTNILAIFLAIVCLVRTSRAGRLQIQGAQPEELKLKLHVETAELTVGRVIAAGGADKESEAATTGLASDTAQRIEPSIAEADGIKHGDEGAAAEEYFISRSGKVYSKTEVLRQIRD